MSSVLCLSSFDASRVSFGLRRSPGLQEYGAGQRVGKTVIRVAPNRRHGNEFRQTVGGREPEPDQAEE